MTRAPLARGWVVPLAAVLAGCGPAAVSDRAAAPARQSESHEDGHDHDAPTSFADGVVKLEALGRDLADRLAEQAGEAADDLVHEIGHLLESVRGLAERDGVAAAAARHLEELEECFGKVDEAFHSADEKSDPRGALESVRERLAAAFASLREVAR